jgi:hypothetical protein
MHSGCFFLPIGTQSRVSIPQEKAVGAKLDKLLEIEGYESLDRLLDDVVGDSVSPAICMNAGCNYVCEMEPDQTRGWCDECRTNSMKSALVLAGVI